MKPFQYGLLAAAFLFHATFAYADPYVIDADHSTVSFKIRHMLSYVRGSFNAVEGKFDYDPAKPETWGCEALIQAESIDTNLAPRDNHLRSADFLDIAQYPTLSFKSTKLTDVTPTSAKVEGVLLLHGVEKPVILDLEMHGVVKDPWGGVRSSFSATTTINRKDFGLAWNKAVETGELLVGDEVKIEIEIEGIRQA